MAEPINFLQERRTRRPGEEVVVEKPPRRRSPAQQEQTPAPPPQREPELEQKPEPKKGPRCSCCGHSREKAKVFLDLGRGVLLCDGCIEVCNEILSEEGVATDTPASPKQANTSFSYSSTRTIYRCSFCGKEQERVARLIAMLNNIFICNGCVGLCNGGITQALAGASVEAEEARDEPVHTHS